MERKNRAGRGCWGKRLLACVSWMCLVSCISDYEPKGIDMMSGLLVVDGMITDGETVIDLRRSVGLTDEFTEAEFVTDAQVVVERGDGTTYPAPRVSDKGQYKAVTGDLDMNQTYRLRVTLDGLAYESDFLKPVRTPPIDTISLLKKGKGQEVNLCVSTHGDAAGSRYYRWKYKEDWEVHSEMFMVSEWDDYMTMIFYDRETANNLYYCWGKDSTKIMQLATSDKLTENVISNKSLATYSPGDRRLAVLYHVAVEQYALRAEAYNYYFNLQKNIEDTGSLFAPIPSEMKGNIRCVTDPSIPVIGYVEVTTVSRMNRFMPEIKQVYEPPFSSCGLSTVTGDDIFEFYMNSGYGFVIYNMVDMASCVLAPKTCLDCRRYGTKQRPSWWPNNHL